MVNPVPNLTRRVLEVYRYTGVKDEELHSLAAGFLSLSHYNSEWYDEAIAAIGWATEHLKEGLASPLTEALGLLVEQAQLKGDEDDLLEFCSKLRG
jgi:hypothetical protein